MNIQLNRLYGILTNGDTAIRQTNASRTDLSTRTQDIAKALIPPTLSAAAQRALAELYIRLCTTDRELQYLLKKVDPINSYKLHSFYPEFSGVDINNIVINIKRLILPNTEKSFLPFDYVRLALRSLLQALDGE